MVPRPRWRHYINMSVVPIDRRLYFPIAVRTPTAGDGRRTVGATDMFLQCAQWVRPANAVGDRSMPVASICSVLCCLIAAHTHTDGRQWPPCSQHYKPSLTISRSENAAQPKRRKKLRHQRASESAVESTLFSERKKTSDPQRHRRASPSIPRKGRGEPPCSQRKGSPRGPPPKERLKE